MNDPVSIATAADGAYAMPLAVMLTSVQQCLNQRPVQVYVIDGGISNRKKDRVLSSLDPSMMDVEWVKPDLSKLGAVDTGGHVSIATYFRLLIPSHLPASLQRVIYLDADLVVRRDLAELWECIQGGAPLYAVQDGMNVVGDEKGVFNWKGLGLSPESPYLNAGVLGINLSYFRRRKVAEEVVRYLHRHESDAYFWDQGGLNAILAEKWTPLDRRWNQTHLINRPQHWLKRGMSWEEYKRLRDDPYIIHYSGSTKPWHYLCGDDRKEAFCDVLEHTDWADYEPPLPPLEQKVGKIAGRYLRRVRRWWVEDE